MVVPVVPRGSLEYVEASLLVPLWYRGGRGGRPEIATSIGGLLARHMLRTRHTSHTLCAIITVVQDYAVCMYTLYVNVFESLRASLQSFILVAI